jgi:hypothetical protein
MVDPDFESTLNAPDDEPDEAHLDALAEAAIDPGRGVPHPKVREWLKKLANGEEAPPPIE